MRILPFLLMLLVILACKNNESSNRANLEPKPTESIAIEEPKKPANIEIPYLANKSEKAVESLLGKPISTSKLNKNDDTGEVSWDYKFGEDSIFINFKRGKANYFHYISKNHFDTLFELGNLVGVDLKGIEPNSSNPVQVTYKGLIAGIEWNEIRVVTSTDGKFSIITFRVVK